MPVATTRMALHRPLMNTTRSGLFLVGQDAMEFVLDGVIRLPVE